MGLLDDAIREHLELKRRRGSDPAEITRQEQEALGPARRSTEPADTDTEDDAPSSAKDPAARSEPPKPLPDPDEDFFVDDPDDPFLPDEVDESDVPPPSRGPAPSREAPPEPLPSSPPPSREAPPEPLPSSPPPAEPAAEDPWDDETAAIVDAPQPPAPRRSAAQRLAELDEAEARRRATSAAPPPDAEPLEQPVGESREFTVDDVDEAGGHDDASDDIVPADEEHDGEDLLEETPDFLEETPEHDRLWFEQRPPRDFDFDG